MLMLNTFLNFTIFLFTFHFFHLFQINKTFIEKGVTNDLLHGKPISFVPLTSKIMEEVINNQTLSFLTKTNMLNANQSGFHQQVATTFCLPSLSVIKSKWI